MAGDDKPGIAAAVEAVEAGAPPSGPVARQLPLMIVGDLAEPDAGGEAAAAGEAFKRGAGRPPGARNRRTEEWVDYLLNRYPSPLIALAEAYSRPVEDLARELECSKLEAYELQMEAAEKLAPFIHQKQPLAVQVDSKGVVQLVIADPRSLAAQALGNDAAMVLEAVVVAEAGESEDAKKSEG